MSNKYQVLTLNALAARAGKLPLQTQRPRMTSRGIQRMADRFALYSPAETYATDERAKAYDAVWGVSADSQIAAFVDIERVRTKCRA